MKVLVGFIVSIVTLSGFFFSTQKEDVSHIPKNEIIRITYHRGISEPEDGIKWSYEVDLNKKECTMYCSSTGLLRDEKLIEENSYKKIKTRFISYNEYSVLSQIINEPDKYIDNGVISNKDGYIIQDDNISLFIPETDANADILKGITERY